MYQLNKTAKTNFIKTMLEIAGLVKENFSKLTFALVLVLLNSLITIFSPYFIGLITDELILKGLRYELFVALILLFSIYLVYSLSSYFQIRVIGKVGVDTVHKLRNKIFEKLNELPISFFNSNKSGDLISRINNDTEVLNGLFSEVLVRFFLSFFNIAGIGIFLTFLNPKLGVLSVGLIIPLFVYTIATNRLFRNINKKSLDSLGSLSSEISEGLNNFKTFIIFNKREFFNERIKKSIDDNFRKSTLASFVNGVSSLIYDLAGNLATVLVITFGLQMVKNVEITLGTLIAFLLLVNRFYEPLKTLASLVGTIQRSLASWDRINEILRMETNLKVTQKENEKIYSNEKTMIKMIDVDFGYDHSLVLKDVNLEIEKGKTYALVGPTGSGKSTLASMIMRLHDPVSGKIILNGYDLKSFRPDEISDQIGFILQEPFLIEGTLEENLKYGNRKLNHLTKSELLKEIENRNLKEVLNKFRNGLDEYVGVNSYLSLGQKQLVTFMRAILRDPKLLIMDEATSNVDTKTEKLFQAILDSLPADTSKFIIAHKLNTIRKADEIYLIANGRVEKIENLQVVLEIIRKSDY